MQWKKIENDHLKGSRRHGALIYQDKLHIFCGNKSTPTKKNHSNDFNVYSPREKSFFSIEPKKNITPTFGFSYTLYKDNIYLFGSDPKIIFYKNMIYTFSFTDLTWKKLEYYGDVALRKYGSCLVAYNGKLIITGGERISKSEDFVLEYDIENNILKTIETNWELPPIFAHQCIEYKGMMYLFGGKSTNHRFNHLFSFDLDSYEWENINGFGQVPSIRAGHSMTECLGKIYIYGGFNGSEELNDLYQYDIESKVWKEILTYSPPNPSSFTSLTSFIQNNEIILYLYGGISTPNRSNLSEYIIFKDFHEISIFNFFMDHLFLNTQKVKDIHFRFL